MAYYVCSGAKLRCSMGSEESKLEVVHLEKPVLLCGKPMANVMDYKPMANIKPFGQCCSLANPVVAAATAANNGVLRKMRCVPNPIFPWMPGKPNLLIKGQPALMDNCTCGCAWAGPIKITDPGQNTVYEGGPMTITITDPTMETLQSLEGMGDGDGVQGALGRGLQPLRDAVGPGGMGLFPFSQQFMNGDAPDPQDAEMSVQSALWVINVDGADKTFPRQKIVYKAEYNKKRSEMSDDEKKEVTNWMIKVGKNGKYKPLENITGEKITLDIESTWKDEVSVMAHIENTRQFYVKTTEILPDSSSNRLIRGVIGEDEAFVGQKVKYEVTGDNEQSGRSDRKINWAIKIGKNGKIDKDKLKGYVNRESIELEMEPGWSGKEIAIMPYLSSPTEIVSVKTMVEGWNLPVAIAETWQRPWLEADRVTLARDMHCGDMTKTEILRMFPLHFINIASANFENAAHHFREFEHLAKEFFAMNDIRLDIYEIPENLDEVCYLVEEDSFTHKANLESNIESMIKNFKEGKEKNYSNPDLTAAVMSHHDTIRFIGQIRNLLRNKIEEHRGNINLITTTINTDEIRQPQYGSLTDTIEGLTLALNDTWAYKALITEYRMEDDNISYKGKMKIFIYDHFGLDNNDVRITRPSIHFMPLFFHWFVLQRWEGFREEYKPFLTVIQKEFTFKGKLKQL